MTEEKLDKLIINYLTEQQYQTLKDNGKLEENQLYCTTNE